ncbi:MAG: EamA family transporter, partial [Patescibacteria group bacterium]|nr:EamA family transporter [Patescibacteria group bacterium]
MSWIIYSFISLVAFSIMVILITGQTKKGFSVPFTLAFVVGLWIPFFGFWLLWKGVDFFISGQVIIILISGGILAVIANWCTFKSANDSPNPGFTFAITNSSPILIALAGKFFLQKELTFLKLIGILISVAGIIILIFLSAGKREKKKKWWIINSLIALLASAVFAVLIVILLDKGVCSVVILFSTAVLGFTVYFFWSRSESNSLL